MKNTYVYILVYSGNFQMISKEGYSSLEKARNRLEKQGYKPYKNFPMKYHKRGCGFAKIYEIKVV